MSSTPIDVEAEENTDQLEETVLAVMADGVITPDERLIVEAAFARHRLLLSDLAATIRLVRTALHAGIRSAWMARRIEQHDRDICALTK